MSNDHDRDTLRWLKRDAREGKPGAANSLARELRRRASEGKIATQREVMAEHKRRMTTSRETVDDVIDTEAPALDEATWKQHNLDLACGCSGCYGYARDLLQELLT